MHKANTSTVSSQFCRTEIQYNVVFFVLKVFCFTNPKFDFGAALYFCLFSSVSMMVLRSTTGGLTGLQEPAAQLEEAVVSTLCLGMNWGADLVVGDFSHGFPSSLGHGGGAPFTYGLAFPCEETGDLRKSSQQAPGFVA